jgi:hypothetical protein
VVSCSVRDLGRVKLKNLLLWALVDVAQTGGASIRGYSERGRNPLHTLTVMCRR